MAETKLLQDARLRVGALVGVCFLLGSTGWLAWLQNITALADPAQIDFYTMVLGYLSQAAGIGVYMLVRWKAGGRIAGIAAMVTMGLYVALLEPAATSASLVAVVGFGCAMNVVCGFFQGHYLTCLAASVPAPGRGIAFGGGYALSTIATWALSSVADGALAFGVPAVLTCVLLALLAVLCALSANALPALSESQEAEGGRGEKAGAQTPAAVPLRSLVMLAGACVVVVSLVKGAGFSFPTADLSGAVNLELSRLFYGVGLIVAGVVADRDRRYVHVFCAASLAMPFVMLALAGADAPSMTLWAVGYLLFGFFSVFRVLLFTDIADDAGCVWMAGAGLALGRVGDALGTVLCLALAGSPVMLIAVTGVLFMVAAGLMYVLFTRLFSPEKEEDDGFDPLVEFATLYSLSAREQEVVQFVVSGMSNARVARELGVSDATVKFHMRNILKKTGCTNRVEVTSLYQELAESH